MRKLITVVVIAVIIMIALVVLALFYIDLSGHKGLRYDMLLDYENFGSVKIDRYVTEDKIIYKSDAEYPYSFEYSAISEKLSLKKKTMAPLKFTKEAYGVKGQKEITIFSQETIRGDFLFFSPPSFIAIEGFTSGGRIMMFSPDDVMSYMPIMERYNFWKKGAQFFEVMIPTGGAISPVRETLEVRYAGDEYVPIMGRRVEAEKFIISAKTLPEAKISVSKYGHNILSLEIEKMLLKFVLVDSIERPGERFEPALKKLASFFNPEKTPEEPDSQEADPSAEKEIPEELASTQDAALFEKESAKEISFESGKLTLSGKLWAPNEEGLFPAVIIVSETGLVKKGQEYFINSFGELLSKSGFLVLAFDAPGLGKSQGNPLTLSDEKRVQGIIDAAMYLTEYPSARKDSITLIGHGDGGYLVSKAGAALPFVRSCILLDSSLELEKEDYVKETLEKNIHALLDARFFGSLDEKKIGAVRRKTHEHLEKIISSEEEVSSFLGTKLPIKAYREFLTRRPYEAMLSFDGPLFLIFRKDAQDFDLQAIGGLKKVLKKRGHDDKIEVLDKVGDYFGSMTQTEDGSRIFVANKDVASLIADWIIEKGISVEEDLFESAVSQDSEQDEAVPLNIETKTDEMER